MPTDNTELRTLSGIVFIAAGTNQSWHTAFRVAMVPLCLPLRIMVIFWAFFATRPFALLAER
jgi:hypothetical protein